MTTDDPTTGEAPSSRDTSTLRMEGAELGLGTRIGHYVIRERQGEGGFAIVYAAEQEEPALVDLYDAWGKPEKAAEWRAKLPTEQDVVTSDRTRPSPP